MNGFDIVVFARCLVSESTTYPGFRTVLPPASAQCRVGDLFLGFLSFFLGFRRPNLFTGLSGWRATDSPLGTQEPVPDQRTGVYLVHSRPHQIPYEWLKQITMLVGWQASGSLIPTIGVAAVSGPPQSRPRYLDWLMLLSLLRKK